MYVGTEYNVTDEYATTYDSGRLMALNASTGASIWNYSTASGVGGLAVYGNYVYGCSGDGYVFALNKSDGRLVWSYSTGATLFPYFVFPYSSPVVAGGVVYAGLPDGKIYAFDAFNGNIISTYDVGSALGVLTLGNNIIYPGTLSIGNNAIYTVAENGFLYAFSTVINPNMPTPTPTLSPAPSIPEFPVWVLPSIFLVTTLAVVALARSKKPTGERYE